MSLHEALTALQDRLKTEQVRGVRVPPTMRVGGLAKLGSQLERTLRAALETAAVECGTSGQALLDAVGAGSPIRRATAGQVAIALRRIPRARVRGPALRVLLDDLKVEGSVLQRIIELRNRVAHDGEVPPGADESLGELRALTERALAAG